MEKSPPKICPDYTTPKKVLDEFNKDYEEFRSLIPHILKEINYDLESSRIEKIIGEFSDEIAKIYKIIYGNRLQTDKSEAYISKESATSPLIPATDANSEKQSPSMVESF